MWLNTTGFQTAFTAVASNRYAVIVVEQFKTGLVRKHYILRLSAAVTVFTCTLLSEALLVSERGNPQKTATNSCHIQFHIRCSTNIDSILWKKLHGLANKMTVIRSVVTLLVCSTVPLCLRSSSIHWFHRHHCRSSISCTN